MLVLLFLLVEIIQIILYMTKVLGNNRFKPSSNTFLLTVLRRYFFLIICVFVSCVSYAFASVHCCLVVTCLERADLLALVGDGYCNFVTFRCGILG